MKLQNKKVVLTGAASGIGFELLQLLHQEGCEIVAVDLSGEAIDFIEPEVHRYSCDLSKPKNVDKLFTFALKKLGQIDIFIANAGFAYYEEFDNADWSHIERIYSVNTFSPFYSALKLKEISGDKPYQFMTTASTMGIFSLPGYALYSSTKAAVKSFAESYRYQLLKGQYFQVCYPIATKTNFFEEAGGSPVPFPTQTADAVAKAMVRGLKLKKNSVFPAKIFLVTMFLNTFLPVMKIYKYIENKKLKNWLSSRPVLKKKASSKKAATRKTSTKKVASKKVSKKKTTNKGTSKKVSSKKGTAKKRNTKK